MAASSSNDLLQRIKRFYKAVAVTEGADGCGITLDGRPLKTPGKAALVVPTRAAADMIAQEWEAQVEYITFPDMPATRHAFTAIDRVSITRLEVAAEVGRYAGSDLLCYFAEDPKSLVERQEARWAPLLDWALESHGLSFVRASGISHQAQPPETLGRIEGLALELDDFRLAGLAFGGALFGSSILALAVERGRLTGEEAYELSRLDEAFQEEQWGVDAEAAERTARQRSEAILLERWFNALS